MEWVLVYKESDTVYRSSTCLERSLGTVIVQRSVTNFTGNGMGLDIKRRTTMIFWFFFFFFFWN